MRIEQSEEDECSSAFSRTGEDPPGIHGEKDDGGRTCQRVCATKADTLGTESSKR